MEFDKDFIYFATSWALDEFFECKTSEELEDLSHTITLKLKDHLQDNPRFFHISHCDDTLSENEKFVAAKRYEEHVNHACSLALATIAVMCEGEEQEEEEENFSP